MKKAILIFAGLAVSAGLIYKISQSYSKGTKMVGTRTFDKPSAENIPTKL